VLPLLESPDLMIQVGIRSSGHSQDHWQATTGVKQFWSQTVYQQGEELVAQEISQHLQQHQVDEIYVTLDIDCIDASLVSATGTPEPNGLMPEAVTTILTSVGEVCQVSGADLVEVAPFTGSRSVEYPDKTLPIAGEFAKLLLTLLSS